MSISLIAVDIDGTLITSEGRVTGETRAAFRAAGEAGLRLALATGRARDESLPVLRQLPQFSWLIGCSGACVEELSTGREIHRDPLPMETVRALYDRLRGIDCLFELMADGHIYTDRARLERLGTYRNPYYLEIIRATRTPVELEAFLAERRAPVFKLHLFCHSEEEQLAARAKTTDFPLDILSSIPENLEFTQKTANKGAGLRALAGHLGLPRAAVMAIGDNLNDLPMLREAGCPVAVANAAPEAKAAARYLTASNDENGVARAIFAVLDGTVS